MRIGVVTLFPEMVEAVSAYGVVGRAVDRGLATLSTVSPREFAADAHRTVDDRPYGGGPGMVMTCGPLGKAIDAAQDSVGQDARVIYLTPQGRLFDHTVAERLASLEEFVLVAGRYEGIDERLLESHVDEELSLGDFVLSGGEIAAMAVIDSVVRLLPGALGDEQSVAEDSFADGLLDHPHYTRPEEYDGRRVPEVLLSGDHERIARWRQQMSLTRTAERRPDLLQRRGLTDEERKLLDGFGKDNGRHKAAGSRTKS